MAEAGLLAPQAPDMGAVSRSLLSQDAGVLAHAQSEAARIGSIHVHDVLDGLCRSLNAKFMVGGVEVPNLDVLSPLGLLPAVAGLAQDAGRHLLGADFGCELRRIGADEPSMLGARCVIPPMTGHIADLTRTLFIVHYATEVFGLRKDAVIEVLPLQESLWPVFAAHVDAHAQDVKGAVPWPQITREL